MIIEKVRFLSSYSSTTPDVVVSYAWKDGKKSTTFFSIPEELEAALLLLEIADNAADFQPQLDRLLTAKRLFDEGYALLKELR